MPYYEMKLKVKVEESKTNAFDPTPDQASAMVSIALRKYLERNHPKDKFYIEEYEISEAKKVS